MDRLVGMMERLVGVVVAFPFVGALFQLFPGREMYRWIAVLASFCSSVCSFLPLWPQVSKGVEGFAPWLWTETYSVQYLVGGYGFNAVMLLLIGIVFPLLVILEARQKESVFARGGLLASLLVMQGSLAGAVLAQDLFLQCVFWSLASIPAYLCVSIWGNGDRELSGFRYLVWSSLGNSALFAALLLIAAGQEHVSFLYRDLALFEQSTQVFHLGFGFHIPLVKSVFWAVCLGFMCRLPFFPLHAWFAACIRDARPSGAIALCAVMTPVGLSLFMRMCGELFPQVLREYAHLMAVLGFLNVVFGALFALCQTHLMRLLAFVTMAQVGFGLIGMGSTEVIATEGAMMGLFYLGLNGAGLGCVFGLLSERMGSPFFKEGGVFRVRGLIASMPKTAALAAVFLASLLGLPGFSGFLGFSMVLMGSFTRFPLLVLFAGLSVLVASLHVVSIFQNLFLGQFKGEALPDLTFNEKMVLLPLVGCVIYFGISPAFLFELVHANLPQALR
jgi:NADH-quinone oxidoreductase subunit M